MSFLVYTTKRIIYFPYDMNVTKENNPEEETTKSIKPWKVIAIIVVLVLVGGAGFVLAYFYDPNDVLKNNKNILNSHSDINNLSKEEKFNSIKYFDNTIEYAYNMWATNMDKILSNKDCPDHIYEDMKLIHKWIKYYANLIYSDNNSISEYCRIKLKNEEDVTSCIKDIKNAIHTKISFITYDVMYNEKLLIEPSKIGTENIRCENLYNYLQY